MGTLGAAAANGICGRNGMGAEGAPGTAVPVPVLERVTRAASPSLRFVSERRGPLLMSRLRRQYLDTDTGIGSLRPGESNRGWSQIAHHEDDAGSPARS